MKIQHLVLLALAAFAGLSPRAGAQAFVDLGSASSFAVLAGTAVTLSDSGTIHGDIGYGSTFAPGSFTVNGTAYTGAGTYTGAQAALTTAYSAITGQSSTSTVSTELGGTTRTSGVYDSAAGTFGITGTLTLDGSGDTNSVFIFKMATTLTTAGSSQVLLTNGARAGNVFWQVGSSATLGGTSFLAGNVLAQTAITAGIGASVDGRLLARDAAVTLNGTNTVTAIPEPATTAMLMGLVGLGLVIGVRRIGRH